MHEDCTAGGASVDIMAVAAALGAGATEAVDDAVGECVARPVFVAEVRGLLLGAEERAAAFEAALADKEVRPPLPLLRLLCTAHPHRFLANRFVATSCEDLDDSNRACPTLPEGAHRLGSCMATHALTPRCRRLCYDMSRRVAWASSPIHLCLFCAGACLRVRG